MAASNNGMLYSRENEQATAIVRNMNEYYIILNKKGKARNN